MHTICLAHSELAEGRWSDLSPQSARWAGDEELHVASRGQQFVSDVGDCRAPREWLSDIRAAMEQEMRTLIYKRTHSGDPDLQSGVLGNNDCMGTVKSCSNDAVIGIGGIGPEPKRKGIAGKLTWVGIGPHKVFDNPAKPLSPRVTFDHFLYLEEDPPNYRSGIQPLQGACSRRTSEY